MRHGGNSNPPAGKGILREVGGGGGAAAKAQEQAAADGASDLSYIPLPHEKTYYEELLLSASDYAVSNPQVISLDKAWSFLSLSGLPSFHLKIILSTAKSTAATSRGAEKAPTSSSSSASSSSLTRSEFFVAVRLVQLRQNGRKVTDLNLNAVDEDSGGPPLKPAHFEGVSDVTVPLPQQLLPPPEKKKKGGSKHNNLAPKHKQGQGVAPSSSERRRNSLTHSRSFPSRMSDIMNSDSMMGESTMTSHGAVMGRGSEKGDSDAKDAPYRRPSLKQHSSDGRISDRSHRKSSSRQQRELAQGVPAVQKEGGGGENDTKAVTVGVPLSSGPCCPTCAERSDQTSSLVLKMWEMQKELAETREAFQRLAAEVDVMKREASEKAEAEREILKRRQRQVDKMKSRRESKRRDLARRPSDRHSSRRAKDDANERFDDRIDKRLQVQSVTQRRPSLGRNGTTSTRGEGRPRSLSNPMPYTFDDRSSGAQYAPAASSGRREPPRTERPPPLRSKIKRRHSLKSFSDLLHEDDDDSEENDTRSLSKLKTADVDGEERKQSDIMSMFSLKGPSSWFGRSKPASGRKGKEEEKEEEKEQVPGVIMASDQSNNGINDADPYW